MQDDPHLRRKSSADSIRCFLLETPLDIHILYGNRRRNPYRICQFICTKNYFYPLVFARKELRSIGLNFKFFSEPTDSFFDCDCVFITSHQAAHVENISWTDRERWRQFAHALRNKANRIVWFDLRDSAGTPQFEVIPYVDLYCKQTLYKDRNSYRKKLYGNREFTDFFHHNFGIVDDYDEDYSFLAEADESKVCVSWDIGARFNRLGPNSIGKIVDLAKEVAPVYAGSGPSLRLHAPRADRSIDISALMSVSRYPRRTIAHQRKLAMEILTPLASDKVLSAKVPPKVYADTLRKSKLVLSCFGAGEVCYREHEAWQAGACVLMPDMSSIETWPNRYRAKETYWPLSWDLSDLLDSMDLLLRTEAARIEIAIEGQRAFSWLFSQAGREALALRVAAIAKGIPPS